MVFTPEMTCKINHVLSVSKQENRRMLYEYEVYQILKILEFDIPQYILLQEEQEVDADELHRFGNRAVMKVI